MDSAKNEIDYEFLPFLRVYKDGHVERFLGTNTVPATTDPLTGVSSKDLTIIPQTGVSARLYLPNLTTTTQKLPVLLYFHGGGFLVSSTSSPSYHNYLNKIVAEAQIVAVSVDYRRPPEHPLPAAYEDSWAALQWITSHRNHDGPEHWLNNHADFDRVFLAGETSGANIAHNLAMMAGGGGSRRLDVEILGLALIHPLFWGADPIGSEGLDPYEKGEMDRLWHIAFPSSLENNDPRVNPVSEPPSLAGLGCRRVLVCLAEKDITRDRGWLYYEALGRSGWTGVVEIQETEEEMHAFHLYTESEKAKDLIRRLTTFYNSDMPPLL